MRALSWLWVFVSGFSTASFALAAECPHPWVCESLNFKIPVSRFIRVKATLRAGYLPASAAVPFSGNILYFEGLGDSMLNHRPLFQKLSEAGYRVIAFDYMGQGGSTGRMNHTAIDVIPEIGKQVWARYARDLVHFPKKRIIGWSTGGLAAYYTASRNEADQVVLIAPGIAPNAVVGEGLWNWPPDEITLESLTTDRYLPGQVNPHVDPIRPNSPAKVPSFAVRLLTTAFQSGKWKIPSTVSGFVLLSGDDDTYVNSEKTKNIVSRNASHFLLKNYAGALHEIDNERLPIREEAHQDILNFLKNGTI